MLHTVEVDQSGRTDVLTVNTVLAFSDGIQAAILVPAAVKRGCYWRLKTTGMRKQAIGIRLFAAGVVLLLQPYINSMELIVVDQEYDGWDALIKEHLLRYLRKERPDLSAQQIAFRQIGKGSRSHSLALAIYRGDREPTRRIGEEDLLAVC